jgi:hypothetical protein
MGQSGLGTLDVVPTSGPAPVVNARIYNDGGAAGTVGFSEAALRPQDALQTGETGILIAPSDLTRFRFNLGVRTLSSGVTATIEVWDAAGALVTTVQKQYPKTFFLQAKASDFLGVDVPADASVEITVTAGSAVFYGSVVDNVTQDPSTQFAIHDQVDE